MRKFVLWEDAITKAAEHEGTKNTMKTKPVQPDLDAIRKRFGADNDAWQAYAEGASRGTRAHSDAVYTLWLRAALPVTKALEDSGVSPAAARDIAARAIPTWYSSLRLAQNPRSPTTRADIEAAAARVESIAKMIASTAVQKSAASGGGLEQVMMGVGASFDWSEE
jgi:hypothetical protein